MNRYQIELSLTEAEEMKGIIRRGAHSTQVYRAAYVLLNCDQGPYGKKKAMLLSPPYFGWDMLL